MDDSGLFFFFLPASRTCLSSHTEACGVNQTVLSSYLFVDVRNLHRDKNCVTNACRRVWPLCLRPCTEHQQLSTLVMMMIPKGLIPLTSCHAYFRWIQCLRTEHSSLTLRTAVCVSASRAKRGASVHAAESTSFSTESECRRFRPWRDPTWRLVWLRELFLLPRFPLGNNCRLSTITHSLGRISTAKANTQRDWCACLPTFEKETRPTSHSGFPPLSSCLILTVHMMFAHLQSLTCIWSWESPTFV